MGLLKEFKDFAMKGNVLDLAVGVIIGQEFGKIVNSLVKDVIMPPLGQLIGRTDFEKLQIKLGEGADATLKYGSFLQACVNFTIIAFAVFMVIKAKNVAEKRVLGITDPKAPPPPPEDVLLLREIRDELKQRRPATH
jgi:large conductance mechanosensitive channel